LEADTSVLSLLLPAILFSANLPGNLYVEESKLAIVKYAGVEQRKPAAVTLDIRPHGGEL
jgi:hypothetical protein